jgi:hypothetical protein
MTDTEREYKEFDKRIEFRLSWFVRIAAAMSVAASLLISVIGIWTLVLIFQGRWPRPSLVAGIGLVVTIAIAADVVRRVGVAMGDIWREYVLTKQGVQVLDWKGRVRENLAWNLLSSCQFDKVGKSLVCRFNSQRRVIRLINPDISGRLDRIVAAVELIRGCTDINISGATL